MNLSNDFKTLLSAGKTLLNVREDDTTWNTTNTLFETANTHIDQHHSDISLSHVLDAFVRDLEPLIFRSLLSDRSRLSGTLCTFITHLYSNKLYNPNPNPNDGKSDVLFWKSQDFIYTLCTHLFKLCGRPNKVFSGRGESCLMIVVVHVRRPVPLFREYYVSANKNVRYVVYKCIKKFVSFNEIEMSTTIKNEDKKIFCGVDVNKCRANLNADDICFVISMIEKGSSDAFSDTRQICKSLLKAYNCVPEIVVQDKPRKAGFYNPPSLNKKQKSGGDEVLEIKTEGNIRHGFFSGIPRKAYDVLRKFSPFTKKCKVDAIKVIKNNPLDVNKCDNLENKKSCDENKIVQEAKNSVDNKIKDKKDGDKKEHLDISTKSNTKNVGFFHRLKPKNRKAIKPIDHPASNDIENDPLYKIKQMNSTPKKNIVTSNCLTPKRLEEYIKKYKNDVAGDRNFFERIGVNVSEDKNNENFLVEHNNDNLQDNEIKKNVDMKTMEAEDQKHQNDSEKNQEIFVNNINYGFIKGSEYQIVNNNILDKDEEIHAIKNSSDDFMNSPLDVFVGNEEIDMLRKDEDDVLINDKKEEKVKSEIILKNRDEDNLKTNIQDSNVKEDWLFKEVIDNDGSGNQNKDIEILDTKEKTVENDIEEIKDTDNRNPNDNKEEMIENILEGNHDNRNDTMESNQEMIDIKHLKDEIQNNINVMEGNEEMNDAIDSKHEINNNIEAIEEMIKDSDYRNTGDNIEIVDYKEEMIYAINNKQTINNNIEAIEEMIKDSDYRNTGDNIEIVDYKEEMIYAINNKQTINNNIEDIEEIIKDSDIEIVDYKEEMIYAINNKQTINNNIEDIEEIIKDSDIEIVDDKEEMIYAINNNIEDIEEIIKDSDIEIVDYKEEMIDSIVLNHEINHNIEAIEEMIKDSDYRNQSDDIEIVENKEEMIDAINFKQAINNNIETIDINEKTLQDIKEEKCEQTENTIINNVNFHNQDSSFENIVIKKTSIEFNLKENNSFAVLNDDNSFINENISKSFTNGMTNDSNIIEDSFIKDNIDKSFNELSLNKTINISFDEINDVENSFNNLSMNNDKSGNNLFSSKDCDSLKNLSVNNNKTGNNSILTQVYENKDIYNDSNIEIAENIENEEINQSIVNLSINEKEVNEIHNKDNSFNDNLEKKNPEAMEICNIDKNFINDDANLTMIDKNVYVNRNAIIKNNQNNDKNN